MALSMFDLITEVVCRGERTTAEVVKQYCKPNEVVYPRQLIMYFAREFEIGSLAVIGAKFGKDHATVSHAVTVIRNYLATDKIKRKQIEGYRRKLSGIEKVNSTCSLLRVEIAEIGHQITDLQDKIVTLQRSLSEAQDILDKLNI